MNDILRKIYDNVLVYENDTIKINKKIDSEINTFIEQYIGILKADDIEQYKNDLSSIALIAEQTGFELGVKFILNILCSTTD